MNLVARWLKNSVRTLPKRSHGISEPHPLLEPETDLLSVVVAEAQLAEAERLIPTVADKTEAAAVVEAHRPPGNLDQGCNRLLFFVRQYPHEERFQVLLARLFEAHRDPRAAKIWRGINVRFGQSSEAFRLVLRWAQRDFGYDRAQALLNQRYPEQPSDPSELINYARACEELRNFTEADDAYSRIEQMGASKASHYSSIVAAVRKRGEFDRALAILQRAQERYGKSARLLQIAEEIRREIEEVKVLLPNISFGSQKITSAVLDRVLSDLAAERKRQPVPAFGAIGSLVMMNGSLGCGGAERQFVATAIALQNHITMGEPIDGHDASGPINVICRSLRSRPDADFFLNDLERHDIQVMEYVDFPDFGGKVRNSVSKGLTALLRHLPHPTAESIRKVPDVLAAIRPDILHLWQDGIILANCVSALLSGASKIVLSVRSVPPVDRPERNRHEYLSVYRSLLLSPGVRLTANSQMAARRYAEWLEIDPRRVAVIRNGSRALPSSPSGDAAARFAAFQGRTAGANFTVGSVFRFDENKRPFLWLDSAARMLAENPHCRFVMVGDGPLLVPAQEYATRLGLAARVLFVGRSDCVGYWISKMDLFLLLSRFEGLPNVLIEAQFGGIPVVTTDAGGAAETILPGRTGTVLPNQNTPAPGAIAAAALAWQRDREGRAAIAEDAKQFAIASFSIDAMLAQTVAVYMDQD